MFNPHAIILRLTTNGNHIVEKHIIVVKHLHLNIHALDNYDRGDQRELDANH